MRKIVVLVSFLALAGTLNAQWASKAQFAGAARTNAVGFSIGNKGYIGTGYSDFTTSYYKDFWEWNQATNTWTQKADFPGTARACAVGFSIGTKGYIGTGNTQTGTSNDFWEWDQATNIWTKKADFPGGANVENAAAFVIGTKGYICGTNGQLWEWDQATNTWTQKASLAGVARSMAVGFSIGTKGYIATGNYLSTSLWDMWQWSQDSNAWTKKANYAAGGRDDAVAFSIGNRGYVGTGHENSSGYSYRNFYYWNQNTDTWTMVPPVGFGTMEGMCVGFSIANKGYVGTGYNDNGDPLKEFYELGTPAGIDNNEEDVQCMVYPNPVSTSATFMLSPSLIRANHDLVLVLTDVPGNVVFSKSIESENTTIDRGSLTAGIYFYRLMSDEQVFTYGKIIIE